MGESFGKSPLYGPSICVSLPPRIPMLKLYPQVPLGGDEE